MDEIQNVGWPLLALVGGYVFVTSCNLTRFWCSQYTGHRLYFCAALAGVLSIALARLIQLAVDIEWGPLLSPTLGEWPSIAILFVLAGMVGHAYYRQDQIDDLASIGKVAVLATASTLAFLLAYTIHHLVRAVANGTKPVAVITVVGVVLTIGIMRWLRQRWFVTSFRVGLFGLVVYLAFTLAAYKQPEIMEWWGRFLANQEAALFCLSFVISVLLWWPLNLLFPRDDIKTLMVRYGYEDPMEGLFWMAFKNEEIVQINMANGKVYIGYLMEVPPSLGVPDPFIRILPVISGYRKDETHKLQLVTYYQRIYQQKQGEVIGRQELKILAKVFEKVIDCEQIVSASLFDPNVFRDFADDDGVKQHPLPIEAT